VLDTIESAYAGATVGQTFRGTRTVDVVVLLRDEARHQPTQVQQLMISSPLGPVPLSQVANVEVTTDRYAIQHDAGQRLVIVTFNVNGGSLQDVVKQAQQTIAQSVALPSGVFMEFTGAAYDAGSVVGGDTAPSLYPVFSSCGADHVDGAAFVSAIL